MRRLLAIVLSLGLLAAACGDDSDAADTATTTTTVPTTTEAPAMTSTTTTTTEAPPEVTGLDYAEIGPYPVGVTTRTLPSGTRMEVWYPSGPDAVDQTDTYSVRDFTPEVMRVLVPEGTNDRFTVNAGRDASASPVGPFPLVYFSHGSTSFRFQSTTLTHHLASWGMVVASVDHVSRSLPGMLGRPDGLPSSVDDIDEAALILFTDETLAAMIDAERIGISGHSAGGGTTLAVAAQGDIDGYVSYASAASADGDLPDVPSLFMAGSIDTIVPPDRTRDAFDRAPAPSWYLEFADSGHLAFSDLCVVGDGDANLIGLAEAAGLGDFLTDGIRRLGSDGCEPPNRPVKEVWPAIHQATTGFFLWVFGVDPEPLGLDEFTVDGITVESS
jgi:dienelactone hydrolase